MTNYGNIHHSKLKVDYMLNNQCKLLKDIMFWSTSLINV